MVVVCTTRWMFVARRAQLHHIIYDKISESKEMRYVLKPILCKEGVTLQLKNQLK